MGCFHLIASLIVGLIIGLCARFLLPGSDPMGFWMTAILGVAGSLVGGVIGGLISKPAPGSKFHPAGFILSVICSILLLVIWRYLHH